MGSNNLATVMNGGGPNPETQSQAGAFVPAIGQGGPVQPPGRDWGARVRTELADLRAAIAALNDAMSATMAVLDNLLEVFSSQV